jgi:ankyrin repeat protein
MTTDAFLWQMARNIAKGNNVGDIGEDPNSKSRLDIGTAQANHNMLLGFLELFRKSEKEVYLKIAERIGSNILDSYFHNGFFVPSSKHLYAKFDNVAPLVLLHLATSLQTEAPRMPQVWPTSSYFHCPYDGFGRTYDWTVIYRQTEENHWDFEVFAAVHSGDVREVSEVISKGANINATNGSFWGDTPLHYAVRQGHKKIVELLLAKGADVNGRNRNGETPIDVVGSQDRHEIARLLVTHNATVSTIHTAARLGDAEQVRAFLERGSDVNAQNERGRTALYVAVSENCEDLAEFLIDNGADVNTKDNKGYTPLYEAIWNSDANMVDLLVTNGADVNYTPEKDYPPLHYAVWWWNLKIARSLVDHGADCDAKDQDGWTAFRYAVNSANKKMVDLFVAKGADVPGIHRAACLGDLARVKSFLEQGTDVDVKDEMGWTPLYWAASMGQEEVGEFLVGKRAQIDIRTKGQRAPLHQVACSGAFRLAELLISKGADVEAQDKRKETPLHSAAANNHRQIAELLIEKGADVNAATASGRTPLHSAAMYGNKDVVTLLLAKGADATIKDSRDRTAHDWAKLRGHTEVADMLLTALDLAAMTTEKSSKSHETIDVNQPTHQLFAAVKADDIEKVEASITDGADVNAKDATGRMPIHYAVANKHKEITELLTAIAVRPGTFEHLELRRVKRLTDQAIDVSSIGHSNTLLHLAAQAGYVYVAAYLIDQGADVDAKNRSGATPTQVAMEKHFNQPIAALLLLDAGATATDRERGIILLRAAQEQGTYGLRRAKYEDQTTPYLSTGGSRSKHDIAISKASVASACIQGGIIPITVTLENRGSYRESFNILLHDRIKEAPLFSESVIFAAPFEGVAHNTADIVFATETLPRSMFSNRVCIGGDVNKDGFADVLIGSVGWHDFRGRAYLYLGGTKMDSAADVILTGFSEGDGFSNNQGGAFGDVNGDGYDDVIIGARPPALLESHDGYVCVYYGGLDMDNSPDVVFRSPETGGEGRFGTVVAGDIDNDGYCDVLAGDSRRERAYLFWGGDPMRTNAETVFRGKNTGNYFGHRMAIGGDVNGDGYNDIIIGSRQGSEYQQGQAYLYFGNTKEEMDADCDWLFKGETAGDNLGSAVDIFDIDNDGYGDVIIGARYAPDNWRGRVYIYWGASDFDGSKPGVVLECNDISSMGEYLQCSYINDDHYGDILVGGWQYPGPPYKHGRAYLFYGNTRMAMDTDRDHIFEGEGCTDDYFGFQVGVGDVNGDGYADALVGSPGASHNMGCAYLYYGPFHSTTDITFNWDTTNASIGKHTLKVEVPPVPGEQNTEDNVKTVSVEIKERAR